MSLQVNLEDMAAAAVHVTRHGEELAARHTASDGRIEAAVGGWAGRSATALANRASRWVSASTTLVTRVEEHAHGLRTSAQIFATTEAQRVGALTVIRQPAVAGGRRQ